MHLPWYHYVKMALVGVTLLPFRILFTIANVFLMWCFATLILAGLSGLHAQRARIFFSERGCACAWMCRCVQSLSACVYFECVLWDAHACRSYFGVETQSDFVCLRTSISCALLWRTL